MTAVAGTDREIARRADEFVKIHRKQIAREVTEGFAPEESPVSIFMAGSPGAGKTETSIRLLLNTANLLRIDADELREYFKVCGYNGANSHLFQKAASNLAHEIHNFAIKKEFGFLLDGTFATENVARLNIERSSKRGRPIVIVFVYQSPQIAWDFVSHREAIEGRRIRPQDFAAKFCVSWAVANKMKAEFGDKVMLTLVYKNPDDSNKYYRNDIARIDDHVSERFDEAQILKAILG